MKPTNVTCHVEGTIATVTINRPKVMNALNTQTVVEIGRAIDSLAVDDTVRGVIITGAGDKAFVAGADIEELSAKNPISAREFVQIGQEVLNKIERLPKPVVAAVNGFALGGGCEIALACHMRIAAAHASFGQPEIGLGIIPGFGGTQRLPRLIGKGRALELLLGGGMIDAAEAFRIGLANCVIDSYKRDDSGAELKDEKGRKVFDREGFLGTVKKMLNGFAAKAPVAAGYIIDAVNRGLDVALGEALRVEADLFGMIYSTGDAREGLAAFLEKREANFKGS